MWLAVWGLATWRVDSGGTKRASHRRVRLAALLQAFADFAARVFIYLFLFGNKLNKIQLLAARVRRAVTRGGFVVVASA
jgi:hypothetical protein